MGNRFQFGAWRRPVAFFLVLGSFFLLGANGSSNQWGRANAGGTLFWETIRQADYVRGDTQGISIAEDGTLRVAPRVEPVFDTGQPFIWSSVLDAKGNLFLGTGHDGRLYEVDSAGKGTLLADFEELDVTAVTTGDDGEVLAATSPDGKVYRVRPNSQPTVFFDPPDKYIWTLGRGPDGTWYVGTGSQGILYRVDKTGKGEIWLDSNETNLTALVNGPDGKVWLGTDPGALVMRVEGKGKATVVFDSPLKEIHKLAVAGDSVYALGLTERAVAGGAVAASPPAVTSNPQVSVSISIAPEDGATTDAGGTTGSTAKSDSGGNQTALYRLASNGNQDIVWSSPDVAGFDLAPTADGQIFLGTGTRGKIFRIDAEGHSNLIQQTGEDHVTALHPVKGNGWLITTSNLGKLFRLTELTGTEGSFTSPVLDAKFAAQWGKVSWKGTGDVSFFTRSGNTEAADATWNDWVPVGSGIEAGVVKSPVARYFQWKVTLRKDASVRLVRVAYLPQNFAPTVVSLSVVAPGIALQENPQPQIDSGIINAGLDPTQFGLTTGGPPRRVFQKGARSLQWQAEDRNGDQLWYRLWFRPFGESVWHLLAEDVRNPYYCIPSEALADGLYEFKVEASDLPSNVESRAATGYRVSDPIEIDNTPPVLSFSQGPVLSNNELQFEVTVEDVTSGLKRVEYSLDAKEWKQLLPTDGVLDERRERFRVREQVGPATVHYVAVRAFDTCANGGNLKTVVRIGGSSR
ncbi:MAG: WD40 repeat domain-containing protein [Blastocatellia bacterium]|nr:WD40 repeat domain-containing protein [Blastocatellia bacterium]